MLPTILIIIESALLIFILAAYLPYLQNTKKREAKLKEETFKLKIHLELEQSLKQAYLESQKELKEAQRLGRIGNWSWDIATDTINWSDEYYQIMGQDPKQRPPGYEEHLKAYTPESAARLDAAVKRNTQTGEQYILDLEIAKPKGSCRWISARSGTIRDKDGKIVGLRGTAQDITERKDAEKALRESEEYFRTIFDTATDGILIADLETNKITKSNKAIRHLLGYTEDEFKQLSVKDLHPEKDLQYVLSQFERQAKGEFTLSKDLPIKRKDGSIFYADINTNTTTLGGKPVILGYFRDVTERKALENKYESIIDKSNDGIVVIQNGNIVFANPRLITLLGYDKNKIINTAMINFIAMEDKQVIAERYEKRMRGESAPSRYEVKLLTKNNTVFPVEVNISMMKYEGNPAELAIIRDILKAS